MASKAAMTSLLISSALAMPNAWASVTAAAANAITNFRYGARFNWPSFRLGLLAAVVQEKPPLLFAPVQEAGDHCAPGVAPLQELVGCAEVVAGVELHLEFGAFDDPRPAIEGGGDQGDALTNRQPTWMLRSTARAAERRSRVRTRSAFAFRHRCPTRTSGPVWP